MCHLASGQQRNGRKRGNAATILSPASVEDVPLPQNCQDQFLSSVGFLCADRSVVVHCSGITDRPQRCRITSRRSTFARLAAALRQSRKSSLGLHPAVGKTNPQFLSALPLHVLRLCTSFAVMGISRSR